MRFLPALRSVRNDGAFNGIPRGIRGANGSSDAPFLLKRRGVVIPSGARNLLACGADQQECE